MRGCRACGRFRFLVGVVLGPARDGSAEVFVGGPARLGRRPRDPPEARLKPLLPNLILPQSFSDGIVGALRPAINILGDAK